MSAARLALIACLLAACGQKNERWVEERQKAEEHAKVERKAQEEAPAPAPLTGPAPQDPYWDDPSLVAVAPDGPCPEAISALFLGKGKGAHKANDTRFVTRLRPPNDLKLGEFDAPKGQFDMSLAGLIDCSDSAGHVSVGFNEAKATTPNASAAKQGAEVTMRIWLAPPFRLPLPMISMAQAKEFKSHHQFDLEGRVVYRLGKSVVDRKMIHTSKQAAAGISLGGGNEDWGAGRMVRAIVEGVRVTTDRGRTVLVDTPLKH